MIIDPIGDLLTRLRNAYIVRIETVHVPHSRQKMDVLRVLKKNKYIVDYTEVEVDGKKVIEVTLNNVRVTKYVPTFIRISKPGQRIYLGAKDIKKSRNGKGIFIVSTPKGVITGYEARTLNVWGELLCEIY